LDSTKVGFKPRQTNRGLPPNMNSSSQKCR
jgi:hypothetical protein